MSTSGCKTMRLVIAIEQIKLRQSKPNQEVRMRIDLYSLEDIAARLLVKLETVSNYSRAAQFDQFLIVKLSPFVNSKLTARLAHES